jgi:methylenetetrahydrofolate reductase (NADPH)
MIITQMFFDVEVFKQFVTDCRKWGITCPVVPGLMCINAYAGFKKMAKFCKTRVPVALEEKMESLKDDPVATKAYGIEFGANVCKELIDFGSPILHFYTLNLEMVVYGSLDGCGLSTGALSAVKEDDATSMVAVGSAWARVGDKVKSIYGVGVVTEIRAEGAAAIQLDSWLLAGGQHPICYLQKGAYEKVFA